MAAGYSCQRPTTSDNKKTEAPAASVHGALPPPRLPALIVHWAGKRDRNRFIGRLQPRDALLLLAGWNLLHLLARPDFGEVIIGAIALEDQLGVADTLILDRGPAHQQALARSGAQHFVIGIHAADH